MLGTALVMAVVHAPVGAVGLVAVHATIVKVEGEVVLIKKNTQAENVPGLSKDDLLITLAGKPTSGLSLKQIMAILMSESRPIEFVFERHKNWSRNKNGLPSVDQEMLNILFHTFDDTNTGSLDAAGFTEFMREVHEMAMAYTGREKDKLVTAYDHAQVRTNFLFLLFSIPFNSLILFSSII